MVKTVFSLILLLLLDVRPPPAPGPGPPPARPPTERLHKTPENRSRKAVPFWILIGVGFLALLEQQREEKARAARRRMLADEEESRTPYAEEDLMGEHEFKIIRNELDLFDDPQLLAEALREEALAGWEIVEKFDGNRVRLKRPTSQREKDSALPPDFDPYRTATAAMIEGTRKARAAKRRSNLKIWGGFLVGSAIVAVVLWMGITVGPLLPLLFIIAVVCTFCLIKRFSKK
jgi:Flp pilus assembly protein TadB